MMFFKSKSGQYLHLPTTQNPSSAPPLPAAASAGRIELSADAAEPVMSSSVSALTGSSVRRNAKELPSPRGSSVSDGDIARDSADVARDADVANSSSRTEPISRLADGSRNFHQGSRNVPAELSKRAGSTEDGSFVVPLGVERSRGPKQKTGSSGPPPPMDRFTRGLIVFLAATAMLFFILFVSCAFDRSLGTSSAYSTATTQQPLNSFAGNVEQSSASYHPTSPLDALLRSSSSLSASSAWRQHSFRPIGLHSFVHFSSYRTSLREIVVVGFGATSMRDTRQVASCTWVPWAAERVAESAAERAAEATASGAEGAGPDQAGGSGATDQGSSSGSEAGEGAERQAGGSGGEGAAEGGNGTGGDGGGSGSDGGSSGGDNAAKTADVIDPSSFSGAVKETVEVRLPYEDHELAYEVVIFACQLEGLRAAEGGHLFINLDGADFLFYREEPGTFLEAEPHGPFLHNITHCSPPLHSQVSAPRLREWVDFHFRLGVDHSVVHDVGGFSPAVRRELQPFLDLGIVEVLDMHGVVDYTSWYFGQVLMVNDCVYRFRFLSKWVMYLDFDEFIFVQDNQPLSSLLLSYEGMPYVSHGSLWWDLRQCLPEKSIGKDPRWPMERMIWHWPKVYCQHEEQHPDVTKCLNVDGHRKLFVDPRRVTLVENHEVMNPMEGGVDLSTDVLLHHHFHGLLREGADMCLLIQDQEQHVEWWSHGTEMAERVRHVRINPLNFRNVKRKLDWWRRHVATMHIGGFV